MPVRPHSLEPLEIRIAPASLVVTSAADAGAGSLRDILTQSNSTPTVTDTITFSLPVGTKINLMTPLTISDDVVINGPGAGNLFISGNSVTQIFNIDDGTTSAISVSLNGLALINGSSATAGGAIASKEALVITNSYLANNSTADAGGAIYHSSSGGGYLVLNNTKVINNSAPSGIGGGIYARSNSNIALLNSTISGNASSARCGGAFLGEYLGGSGDLYVVNCTIAGNSSQNATGGGLGLDNRQLGTDPQNPADDGRSIVYNSVITGNKAGTDGGGLYFDRGNAFVIGSVIRGNTAIKGGGITDTVNSGSLTITSSSIQNNLATTTAADTGGGGLYVPIKSFSPGFVASLSQVEFVGNRSASSGGAIFDDGAALLLKTTSFRYNTAAGILASSGYGGAIEARVSANVLSTITASVTEFVANTATREGGAVHSTNNGTISLDTVAFTGNHTGTNGGGLFLASAAPAQLKSVAATGNVADARAGGLYFNTNSTVSLDTVLISGNTSKTFAGGVGFDGVGAKSIINALIRDNVTAGTGGGITNNTGTLKLQSVLITSNVARSSGGLHQFGSPALVTIGSNVSIAGNTSNDGAQTNF